MGKRFVSFGGSEVSVCINNNIVDVAAFEIYKKENLSHIDFCKTIPELNNCTLDSVKNIDGVMILEHVITDEELDVASGSAFTINFANEYGSHAVKEIKDVHVVSRKLKLSTQSICVIEVIVLACGAICPFQILEDIEVNEDEQCIDNI